MQHTQSYLASSKTVAMHNQNSEYELVYLIKILMHISYHLNSIKEKSFKTFNSNNQKKLFIIIIKIFNVYEHNEKTRNPHRIRGSRPFG